ncbi:serine/threonine protein kinase [Psychromicrobium sp. YIM B11713]|uniref:serine/threonine protein kinase n=1 Tax=Psychromicrobium sp. YIM B11713 TaxID=3145233 RepID=UPI00374E4E43
MERLFPITPPTVEGLQFRGLLGSSGAAQVWLVSAAKGELYALKCFRTSSTAPQEGVAEGRQLGLRRELRALKALRHDHLIALHDVVKLTAEWLGVTGVLMDYAAGGSLAQLLRHRGRLSPGETVTILTPIFQALGYLHAQGMPHGALSAGNILFSAEGLPRLADLGLAALYRESSPQPAAHPVDGAAGARLTGITSAASVRSPVPRQRSQSFGDDVYALSLLGWWCLSGVPPMPSRRMAALPDGVPQALESALQAGLHPIPELRPQAAGLAKEIFKSAQALPVALSTVEKHAEGIAGTKHTATAAECSAAPVRATGGLSRGVREVLKISQWRGSAPLRRLWPVALVVALGLGVAFYADPMMQLPLGRTLSEARPGQEIPAAMSQATSSDDPLLVLRALSWWRAEAFRSGRAELLEKVNLPGSTAMLNDQRLLQELKNRKHLLRGFDIVVQGLSREQGSQAGWLVVRASFRFSAFQERGIDGSLFSSQSMPTQQDLRLVLKLHQGHWLIAQVFRI